jgi:hypothetical protein
MAFFSSAAPRRISTAAATKANRPVSNLKLMKKTTT